MKEQGIRKVAVRVKGNNLTAMEWAEKKGFKSAYAQKIATAFVALSVETGMEVVEKVHLPHTKKYDHNWRTDQTSRHKMTWEEVKEADSRDTVTGKRLGNEMEEWNMESAAYMCEICDPMEVKRTDEFFVKKMLEKGRITGRGGKPRTHTRRY